MSLIFIFVSIPYHEDSLSVSSYQFKEPSKSLSDATEYGFGKKIGTYEVSWNGHLAFMIWHSMQ